MTKIAMVAGAAVRALPKTYDSYIGVDRGCLYLIKQGLPLDLAVGDFDSVSASELALIRDHSRAVVQAKPEKDDTDLELALKAVFAQNPQASVHVYGALGGRLDHEMSSIFLPSHPDLTAHMQQISLLNVQNQLSYFPAGEHRVEPFPGMTYLSFMVEGSGRLRISGAKYELTDSNYFQRKIYSSNEFLDQPVIFSLDQGYVIVIQSKD
ncbi:thiamine diphosphokinase [Streptococcus caprae]|uniref:Thiamine diphosphokinase n=1 Tax=Streptococcus caprae TaxID=1640501 RepID=A0ABV8CTB4_9STRE